jgi:peptide-methionine (S)-S-oxide reductase
MKLEEAVFGGGCFWCTEAIFKSLKGVEKVTPGYAGGNMDNPSYDMVSSGTTGHAEVTKIEFDPRTISYSDLLDVFWQTHDPTTRNRQGNDIGTQYRSIILYKDEKQKNEAERSLKNIENEKVFKDPIVTEIAPLEKFYEAESYHKDYYDKNIDAPYCQFVISPKLQKLREKFKAKLKE